MAADVNLIAILVAIIGSGGIGAIVTSIANSIRLARAGISGKEDKRREDIIKQRDEAWQRARDAEKAEHLAELEADEERRRRIKWQQLAARYHLQLIRAGVEPSQPWPEDRGVKETT